MRTRGGAALLCGALFAGVALALAGCVHFVPPAPHPSPDVSDFLNATAVPMAPASPGSSPDIADDGGCAGADLEALLDTALTERTGTTQTVVIELRNRGDAACLLADTPALSGLQSAGGEAVPLPLFAEQAVPYPAGELAPGASGRFRVTLLLDGCTRDAESYRFLVIALGGSTTRMDWPVGLSASGCLDSVSPAGLAR